MEHQLSFSTDELDAVVKSLMKSVTANTDKLRRLKEGTSQFRTAQRDGSALTSSLQKAMSAQQAAS